MARRQIALQSTQRTFSFIAGEILETSKQRKGMIPCVFKVTLWERERVGRFGRMALKHVKYHV